MANAAAKEERLRIQREYAYKRSQAGAEYHAEVSGYLRECNEKKTKAWGELRDKIRHAKVHRRAALDQLAYKQRRRTHA